MMNEDFQRQGAEVTQPLATQNLEMYRDFDGRSWESNFENLYHNFVLVRDEWLGDLDFKVELLEFSSTLTALTVVSKYQAHSFHVEEEDKFTEKDFSVD